MAEPQLLAGQSGLPVPNSTKSHWHKEPSEKLFGHRTTADLPHSADVVIVGSGITGAIAAHTLKERRPELNIVMLEAREACWGATGRVSFCNLLLSFALIYLFLVQRTERCSRGGGFIFPQVDSSSEGGNNLTYYASFDSLFFETRL